MPLLYFSHIVSISYCQKTINIAIDDKYRKYRAALGERPRSVVQQMLNHLEEGDKNKDKIILINFVNKMLFINEIPVKEGDIQV